MAMARKSKVRKNKPTIGKRHRRAQRRNERRQRNLIIGVLIAGLAIAAAYSFWPRSPQVVVPESRLVEDPSRGPSTATVTIVEFGDFGCSACRAWHQAGVLDLIEDTYGDSVRIVWRDLPIITAQSPKAAEAGQCAYDQGLFWEYHDLLFARSPRLSVPALKEYASEVGLEIGPFNECLDSGRHAHTVDRDMREAFAIGLRGTPSFVVNNQPLVGPTPQRMVEIIESALANR